MAIEYHQSSSQDFNLLTACPACSYRFDPEERRHVHLSTHTPEDFGLSALGDRNEAAQGPLFEPVEELPEPTVGLHA
jgi:hypothetical protein